MDATKRWITIAGGTCKEDGRRCDTQRRGLKEGNQGEGVAEEKIHCMVNVEIYFEV